MEFIRTKTGILIVILITVFVFGYLMISGVFGGTFIGLTLRSNPDLEVGLVAHYTFDGEYEQGIFEFGTGGATTTDPSDGEDGAYDIVYDDSGYAYVTGTADNDACGGSGTDSCVYTYKVNPSSGEMVWATTTDVTTGDEGGISIAVGQGGYVYVTGGSGLNGFYTFKVDPSNGDMVWATTTNPGSCLDTATAIATDNAGYLYVTGSTGLSGCPFTVDFAIYTMKIDSENGDMVWATTTNPVVGGSTNDKGYGITTDPAGYVYVTGECDGCGTGSADIYTMKLDQNNGDMLWATTTDPVSQHAGQDITTDEAGNLYVTGFCNACGGAGGRAFYTFKVDPINGDMIWATTTDPSAGVDTGYAITADNEGYVYVTGNCGTASSCGSGGNSGMYTFKVDSSNGNMIWATSTDMTSGVEVGRGIATDGTYVYVTGSADNDVCGGGGTDSCHYTFKINASDGSIVDTTTAGAVASIGAKKVPGNIGQGVEFDGVDDYALISDSSSISGLSAITLAAWVKVEDWSIGGFPIIAKSDSADNREYRFRVETGPELKWHISNDGEDPGSNEAQITIASGGLNNNTWHHLVGTYDDSNGDLLVLYIDGEVADSATGDAGGISDEPSDLAIGAYSNGVQFCDCEIDDVRIYDRALSASEISRLYGLGATTKINKTLDTNPDLENGLVGHWTFDGVDTDLSSTTAEFIDRSPNGYYGNWVNHSTSTVAGAIGQAIDFSSNISDNDAVEVLDSDYDLSLTGEGAVTFGAWIYPRSAGQDGGDGRIFDHGGASSGDEGYMFGLSNSNNLWLAINGSSGDYYSSSVDNSINYNEWSHVVATYDDTTNSSAIYVNGVDVTNDGVIDRGTIAINSADRLYIGLKNDSGRDFDGYIDDARIYTRVLSDAEILRLYGLGATTKINKTITTNPDLENGLVGHWTFDGPDIDLGAPTAEIQDRSGNGNDGDWENHATTTFPGAVGQGIVFDGVNDDIELSSPASLDNLSTGPMTLSAWIKPKSFGGTGNRQYIFSKNYSIVGWYFYTQSGSFEDDIAFTVTHTGADLTVYAPDYSIVLNEWQHVAVVWDGTVNSTGVDFFIDGVNVGRRSTGNTEGTGIPDDDDVSVARIANGRSDTGSPFDGTLDDARIYNRALSDAEILRLYQLGQ